MPVNKEDYKHYRETDFLSVRDKLHEGIVLLERFFLDRYEDDELVESQLILTTNYFQSEGVPMIVERKKGQKKPQKQEPLFGPSDAIKFVAFGGDEISIPAVKFLLSYEVFCGDGKLNYLMFDCFVERCSVESVMKSTVKDFGEGLRLQVEPEEDTWQDNWTGKSIPLEPDAVALLKFLEGYSNLPEDVFEDDEDMKETQKLVAHAADIFCKRWPNEATKLGMTPNMT